ncbi:MAG: ABC transporter ATP-binding protein [Pseudomonadota bacterium]
MSFKKRPGLFGAARHQALADLNFSLHAGENLGVLGRNGAGKSTLMALLADIIEADEGVVERNVSSVQLLSLHAGFMPQLSGRQNAIMAGMLLGLRRREITNRLDAIIEFSGLQDQIDEPIRTYSTGMRARLGFAICMQSRPEVLLIDEVLSVGDAAFRPKARRIITERIESDETVVIVSHNEKTLKAYCDRIAWLEDGRIKLLDAADTVLKAYRESLVGQGQGASA